MLFRSPNPFTNELNVRFKLDREGPVLIEIYDLLGKKVFTSDNKLTDLLPAGTYEFGLSNSELGNTHGVLVVKVISSEKTMQIKVNRVD